MAAEANSQANSAFVDDDFSAALQLYANAVQLDPANSEYLVNRAAVHLKLGNYAGRAPAHGPSACVGTTVNHGTALSAMNLQCVGSTS